MAILQQHKVTQGQLFHKPGAFGFSLLTCWLDEFGTEGLTWDPATLALECEDTFHVSITPTNWNKLLAAIAILTTDSFFTSVPDFIRYCCILADEPTAYLASASDCAWGITEGLLINPPDNNEDNPFSPEIRGYLGHVLDQEGILQPPDVLRLALRDDSRIKNVPYTFSDDPELFSSIWKVEAGKVGDINYLVLSRMRALLQELYDLPLKNGNARQLTARMLERLPPVPTEQMPADL